MRAELVRRFYADESGATAIEYGMLAAMIAVAAISAFTVFGSALQNLFGNGVGGAAGKIGAASATIQ